MRTGSGFRVTRVIMLVALLLGVALGASAQAKLDASQLLTKEEVGQITGTTVAAVKTGGNGTTYSTATYVTAEGSTIVVLVQLSRDEAAARAVFESNKNSSKAAAGSDPVPIAGLGERAFWVGGQASVLAVVQGRYWLSITTVLIDNPQEPSKKLAAQVLKRLA